MTEGVANEVAVVIAAWNARSSIGRAVRSALSQSEVVEVVVVDDGSTDDTASVALAAALGDLRLSVIKTEGNRGPAAARNIGIDATTSAFIAILDSDDFFLENRFRGLFEQENWDAIADNIAFVAEDQLAAFATESLASFPADIRQVSLAEFVRANISRRGAPRAELGFAKPLMRREFLNRHSLRYDETLRLGEDYALYVQLIAAGGRFFTVRTCRYVAVERRASLSGQHRVEDLEALLTFCKKFERSGEFAADTARAISAHRAQLQAKVHHRLVLAAKASGGNVAALQKALSSPRSLPTLALSIAADKFGWAKYPEADARYLF